MVQVYEKRGRWKVSGSAKKYASKEDALAAAADCFEVVEPTPEEENIIEPVEVHFDPLEALRSARLKRDGDIEEGSDNGSYNEE